MFSVLEDKALLQRVVIRAVSKMLGLENFNENTLLKNIKLKKLNIWPRTSDTYNELISVYNYNLKSESNKLRKIA